MSEKVLDLLGDLQAAASRIDSLEKRRSEAAGEEERIEANLAVASGELEEKSRVHHALDMERRKKELQLRSDKERHQRIKGRVGEVKTGREYQAVIAETNAARQSVQGQEEAILKDMEAIEALDAEMAQMKEKIASIEAAVTEAKARHERVLTETAAEIEAAREEEKSILSELPAEVVAKYRLIRSRRGGLAVVEAQNEACTACFMRIPPQMYIQVMRKSLVFQCPNCHRILIPPRGDTSRVAQMLFDDD